MEGVTLVETAPTAPPEDQQVVQAMMASTTWLSEAMGIEKRIMEELER